MNTSKSAVEGPLSDLKPNQQLQHCLMLLTRDPYTSNTGRGMVLRTAISSLQALGIKTTIVCFDSNEKTTRDSNDDFLYIGEPRTLDLAIAAVVAFLSKTPMNERIYFSNKKLREVQSIVNNVKPDFVYVDMIRLAKYAAIIDLPTIFDLDDLLSTRYSIAAKAGSVTGFGYLSKKLPRWADHVFRAFGRRVLVREAKLLESREIFYVRKFECTSLVSSLEARDFNEKYNESVHTLPMAIKSNSATTVYSPPKRSVGAEQVVKGMFVGTLNYAPNLEAYRFLIDSVLPEIKSSLEHLEFTLLVVGDKPLSDDVPQPAGVRFLGFVEDLSEAYYQCDLVFAPSFLPGGIKTKFIEAIAHGKPTIANAHATQGLESGELQKIAYYAESASEWAEAVKIIVSDPEKAGERAAKGVGFVQKRFGEQAVLNSWRLIVDTLAAHDETIRKRQ